MPLIEFVGYDKPAALERIARYRPMLHSLEYPEDILFVLDSGTQIIDMENSSDFGFIRVRSRFQSRIDEVSAILGRYEGIESFLIKFAPKEEHA